MGLLNNVLSQPPENNRDAALAVLLVGWKGVDSVLPHNVGVSPEAEDAVVGLRKVQTGFLPVDLLGGMNEGQLPQRTEADADGDVLAPRPLGIERGRVVVEGLPVGRVAVPVEPRTDGLLPDVEVLAEAVDNHVEGRRVLRVLADEVGALVPRDPLAPLDLTPGLDLADLIDELVVQGPVILGPEQLGNDYDIVVPEPPDELLSPAGPHVDAQVGPHKRGGRVKRLGVPAMAPA